MVHAVVWQIWADPLFVTRTLTTYMRVCNFIKDGSMVCTSSPDYMTLYMYMYMYVHVHVLYVLQLAVCTVRTCGLAPVTVPFSVKAIAVPELPRPPLGTRSSVAVEGWRWFAAYCTSTLALLWLGTCKCTEHRRACKHLSLHLFFFSPHGIDVPRILIAKLTEQFQAKRKM